MRLLKALSFFVGLSFILNTLPATLSHILTEEHEHEVHNCESDYCFTSSEDACYVLDLTDIKSSLGAAKSELCIFLPRQMLKTNSYAFLSKRSCFGFRHRGPPSLV